MTAEAVPQQEFTDPNSLQGGFTDPGLGMDENMGMNMDLGISFDDLFGNNATYRPTHGAVNDEFTQWMNTNA